MIKIGYKLMSLLALTCTVGCEPLAGILAERERATPSKSKTSSVPQISAPQTSTDSSSPAHSSPSIPSPSETVSTTSAPLSFRWTKVTVASDVYLLTKASFVDTDTGWVVGSSTKAIKSPSTPHGLIRHTKDGGRTWEVQDKGNDHINDVSFIDKTTGWVCSQGGLIFKTTNGGKSWQPLDSTLTSEIKAIQFGDSNNGLFIGVKDDGKSGVYASNDGGKNWRLIHTGSHGESGRIFFIGKNKAVVRLGRATLHYENGLILPANGIKSIDYPGVAFRDETNGWMYSEGNLYETTDGGKNWTEQDTIATDVGILRNFRIVGMAFLSPKEGLLMLREFIATSHFETTDGGETWTQISSTPDPYYLSHVRLFSSLNMGWAIQPGHPPSDADLWKLSP